jgi:hypothetical protein
MEERKRFSRPVLTTVIMHCRYTQTKMDPMRTSKLRYKWNLLNAIMFQPTVAFDVLKMDLRYLSLKKLQVS